MARNDAAPAACSSAITGPGAMRALASLPALRAFALFIRDHRTPSARQ